VSPATIVDAMSKEIPIMTWSTGRGYSRYIMEKRFKKHLHLIRALEFAFFTGTYFLVRYASFFGDDWFQSWDYPAAVATGGIGTFLFNALVRGIAWVSNGNAMRLYPDRIEMDFSTGEHGTVTFTSFFRDINSCTITEIREGTHPFLLVDLDLKPDLGNIFTRKARVPQFGLPQEIDSTPLFRAFEQSQVTLYRR